MGGGMGGGMGVRTGAGWGVGGWKGAVGGGGGGMCCAREWHGGPGSGMGTPDHRPNPPSNLKLAKADCNGLGGGGLEGPPPSPVVLQE